MEEIKYASDMEKYFAWWLSELVEKGFIDESEYQPKSFQLVGTQKHSYTRRVVLKTKTRLDEKTTTLHRPAVYTPDWKIRFSDRFRNNTKPQVGKVDETLWPCKDPLFVISCAGSWFVDIKGGHTGRGHGDGRYFSLCQKIVREKYSVWPQKIEISNKKGSWFDKTFTPKRYLKTDKSGKARTLKYEPRSVDEFLKQFFL